MSFRLLTLIGGNNTLVARALIDTDALTADRTIALQNSSGTVALLSDIPSFLGTAPKASHVFNSAVQSIPNNTITALTFNSETLDNDAIHSTTTNTSRLTCQTAGQYLAQGQISFAALTGGSRELVLRKNGTTIVGCVRERADDLGTLGVDGSEATKLQVTSPVLDLIVGDYLELTAFQNSGGAVNASAGSGVTWFSMVSQAATGPTGATGPAATQILGTFTAAEAIPSSSLVHASQSTGSLFMADRSLNREAHGFTIAGISNGVTAEITRLGALPGVSGKTAGKKQWLGTGGLTTETVPTSGLLQDVGVASTTSNVFVELQPAILLS